MSATDEHEFYAVWDASYVLGALSPTDRQTYERHLAGCDRCAASVRELAGLPGLLSRVPEDDPARQPVSEPGPPPDLLPKLATAVRRHRRRRRWAVAATATLAAAVCLVLAVVMIRGTGPTRTPAASPSPVAMRLLTPAPLRATAQVEDVSWGTRISMKCRYDRTPGYQPNDYSLVAINRSGRVDALGTWRVVPGKEASFSAGTAWRRGDLAAFEVRAQSGRPLLRLDVR